MSSSSDIVLEISSVLIQKKVSFLDYVFGGTEISLQIAIDFTASNGPPHSIHSLHYMGDSHKNQYLSAIRSVGAILEQYDTDKQFPVYGFGARSVMHGLQFEKSHCFALNGDIFNPEVNGIHGVTTVYQNAINKVELSGPTNFAPILKYVRGFCDHQMK